MQTTQTITPPIEPTPVDPPPRALPRTTAPVCLCGARIGRRETQCRKCSARERWYRRNRLHDDNRRRLDAYRTAALLTGGPR